MAESKKLYKSTMNRLRLNVSAYHNNFSHRRIKEMDPDQLLANCHPSDREGFYNDLRLASRMREKEFEESQKEKS